jgi:hypothetical protein
LRKSDFATEVPSSLAALQLAEETEETGVLINGFDGRNLIGLHHR